VYPPVPTGSKSGRWLLTPILNLIVQLAHHFFGNLQKAINISWLNIALFVGERVKGYSSGYFHLITTF